MGCFNDLPKDVVWLIFKQATLMLLDNEAEIFEEGYPQVTSFVESLHMKCFACVSKNCLKLVKSKCFKATISGYSGWLFRRGALTNGPL